jgi:hypothetical protein
MTPLTPLTITGDTYSPQSLPSSQPPADKEDILKFEKSMESELPEVEVKADSSVNGSGDDLKAEQFKQIRKMMVNYIVMSALDELMNPPIKLDDDLFEM